MLRLLLLLPLILVALLPGCGDAPAPERGGGGADAPAGAGADPHAAPPPPTPGRVLNADRVFGEVAAADPAIYAAPGTPTWFLIQMRRGGMVSFPFAAPDAPRPGQGVELAIVAYRTHTGPLALQVSWGGKPLGVQSSGSAQEGPRVVLRFAVPAALVPSGPAAIDLRDVSPPLPKRDRTDVSDDRGSIWIDAIRATVAGADADAAVEQTGAPADVGVAWIRPKLPAGTTHVILSVPALLGPARRLAAHRTRTGTPSAVVDLAALPRGDPVPALTRLVERLAASGTLRYVLLAGDATYDRADLIDEPTIPAPMARTIYNGATPSDALYLPQAGELSIGRLPFRRAAAMDAFVDRLIAYETHPPADPSRRILRFVTNEARFGPLIDNALEHLFRGVLAGQVPAAFDVEVTFASATSPFLWPPREMNQKVIDDINRGSMFFTYVGHGFQFGFDNLRVGQRHFPVLHAKDASLIDVRGTPPVAFVIACTTAQYDDPEHDGIGEALLKRPRGPIAYWGASRICHPVANSLVGYTLARSMARLAGGLRLGDVLRRAWNDAAAPQRSDLPLKRIRILARLAAQGLDIDRLVAEGRRMYTLLGDPALRIAYPKGDIVLTQLPGKTADVLEIRVEAPFPDGTVVHFSLEQTRDQSVHELEEVADVLDPKWAPVIRANHQKANDWALHRQDLTLRSGAAAIRLTLAGSRAHLVLKAWAITGGDVHQGATLVR